MSLHVNNFTNQERASHCMLEAYTSYSLVLAVEMTWITANVSASPKWPKLCRVGR